ncbi:hypothetical protein PHYSODRAFT_486251 [Phytophthora sojae]|uniref:MULE transposase domain-containing protein n=1 Tax=Phytophthora sojae (strain P6497) TaxID=1094619 RepID=G4YRK7_PHYSP|nr:hypothetical protein PHYSODRAFT_486251 [Phytophthora sojae]EGZ23472.1 hypothetical protein PHYSODRAFT_486251 [Phytophthora sojae]|eukprot:XP_009518760.1 hypothetical protein PHYSODRAFT_486251 [Phytophthora sojae]
MFGALIKYGRMFLDVDVNLACCSIDHCSAIARALETVWPEVIILSCWEHLLGQARKQRSKLVDKSFYKKYALPQLKWLRETRSLNQFRNLSKCVVRWWKLKGETAYAEWLEDIYLTSRWERWSVNSSPIPGVLPIQQAIESHHKVIKEVITAFEKAPTIHVLNSALARLLILGSDTLSDGPQGHFCECE